MQMSTLKELYYDKTKTKYKDEEDPVHMKKEKALFTDCCSCLDKVVKMCDDRLKKDISPECKSQYKKMRTEAHKMCGEMHKHLDYY